ncbi:MAG TPA: dihydrofolate reductase [Candidatus Cloacimonadota bacterium]|nr:dihydrofolate reductase [Candidatus Cloacimonadota bacterium]
MVIAIIAAMDKNGVIGKDGVLPWCILEEMEFFTDSTMGHIVLMGRKTYESLKIKPLPGRISIVVSSDTSYKVAEGVLLFNDLEQAEAMAEEIAQAAGMAVFVIGGRELFEEYLPKADLLYLTQIEASFEGDTKFPVYNPEEWAVIVSERRSSSVGIDFSTSISVRKRP